MKIDSDAAGLDAGRLERITEHLNRAYIEPGKIPGCQTVVYRHGAVGYFSSLGSMDLERDKPVAEDTIWRIYSMTKPITGVALMSLYERGLFRLNDPVHRFIPEWRDLKVSVRQPDGSKQLVEPERPMTVRDALMHMTGLGWGVEGPLVMDRFLQAMAVVRGGREGTLQTMIDNLADKPLVFHPGTRWLYGLSTDVCGRLVEIISGQRFDDYLRTTIFEPLQMHDTAFHVPDSEIDRFAASYGRRKDKTLKLLDNPEKSTYREPPNFLSGGGGLVSTTEDYLRFCRMLLHGGELDGQRVLGRKTIELMSMNHLPGGGELREFALPGGYGETGFDGVGFGLTMAVGLGPVATQSVGSTGDYYWGGAASTIFWIDPAEDLVAIFMTQLMPSGSFDFRGQLKSIIYPAIVD
ncbi:MAG TPA: serine hydrolase domain-containing protein [Acidimicrobiales bacterium]|nr:serine hydrolase domain-containing protein [Acidimicrobiales bacterium]